MLDASRFSARFVADAVAADRVAREVTDASTYPGDADAVPLEHGSAARIQIGGPTVEDFAVFRFVGEQIPGACALGDVSAADDDLASLEQHPDGGIVARADSGGVAGDVFAVFGAGVCVEARVEARRDALA